MSLYIYQPHSISGLNMETKGMRMMKISILLLIILSLFTHTIKSADANQDSDQDEDFVFVPHRPSRILYFEPETLTGMEIDSKNNFGYFGCTYGLIVKNLTNGEFRVISHYDGLYRSEIDIIELDQENSRLYIKTEENNDIFELNLITLEITKIYKLEEAGTMVQGAEFRHMCVEPNMNILYLGSCAGLTELNLNDGSYNFYDVFCFDINYSIIEANKNNIEVESTEFFSINGTDYNSETNELYIATSIGLTIFNTKNKTFQNFRGNSKLAGRINDILFIEEYNKLYLGKERVIRYDIQLKEFFEYPINYDNFNNPNPILKLEYDSKHKLLYCSLEVHEVAIYNPFITKANDAKPRMVFIGNYLPNLEYNDFNNLMYMGYGKIRRLESRWSINFNFQSNGLKVGNKDLNEILIRPNKLVEYEHFFNGGTTWSAAGYNETPLFTYNYDSDSRKPYNITKIQIDAGGVYNIKNHPSKGFTFISTYYSLCIFDSNGNVKKNIETATGKGFDRYPYYDIEFIDDLVFMVSGIGIKVWNLSSSEISDLNINNTIFSGSSIEIGKISGKLYISSNNNITIYDPIKNNLDFIVVNDSIWQFAVDKNEEVAYVGNFDKVYKIFIKNKTTQLFKEKRHLIDINYHSSSNNFIFRFTDAEFITTNENLLIKLPNISSISSIYINQEKDIMYILAGLEYYYTEGKIATGPNTIDGLIVYNLKDQSSINYSINDILPLGAKSGFVTDSTGKILYLIGDKFFVVMNEEDLDRGQIRKQIRTMKIEPAKLKDDNISQDRPGYNYFQIQYYTATTLGIIVISWFLIIFEPGKYKLTALFVTPYYTRLKKRKVLDHQTRGKILGYIQSEPGMHYNELKKNLELNNGTLSYHLRVLEREKHIKSLNKGTYKFFFPGKFNLPSKFFKMNEIQKLIFKKIIEKPGISQKRITKELGSSTSTVNYNIKILEKKRIVKMERIGKETKWYINQENRNHEQDENN